MRNFQEYPWKISYSSNENNPIADFYIPALEAAVEYNRKSGFFNSAILSKVAAGLGAMLANNGKIRLILGCQFSPEDLSAIQKGYELREAIAFRLDAELKPPENFAQLKHFEILSWLIQNGYLDIKIAIPLKQNGMPEESDVASATLRDRLLDSRHLFHEKVGIFTDTKGDKIAFSGSNNESLSGWEANVESFHVYCSWEGERDLERVLEEEYRFEQLWNDLAPNVRIFEIPEAVREKLLRYAPPTKPIWEPVMESDRRPLPSEKLPSQLPNIPPPLTTISETEKEAEKAKFYPLFNLPKSPGCLDYCLRSIPIKPWPHQIKILLQVAREFPKSFLIADEVGLGKTIETGLILRYLLISQQIKRVLILAPASVRPQWQGELREKFNLHFWSYRQGTFTNPHGEKSAPLTNPWNGQNLILASSHLVRRQERLEELLAAEKWDLIILDEAHHARRKNPQSRKDNPNRLLKLMRQLPERTKALILLSATPMQVDAIEVFDLLHLLGLEGHWSYGDNFCNYFASLPGKVDEDALKFWQEMAKDYFNSGGVPCPNLEKYLQKNNRLVGYQLQNIWQRGQTITNHKKVIANQELIVASRQYLSVNTPLKDLMFRHTRDTLRQYYEKGILDRSLPRREVIDNAIVLEGDREVPLYQAVSDYVRHFYKLAEKENRKALGFLMTLYRKRLTSSFYAIKESLKRRLEGINITDDDLGDLEDAGDAVIEGLEPYLEPTDPREIEYLEDVLRQFESTGEDSKLSHFIDTLRAELELRESALIFTQYTDTMDYLRSSLSELYGPSLACYSGRGGELFEGGEWRIVPKENIKNLFREGSVKIMLCTESAAEGLNLQTCGVLINYDLPWNPMRVEQRIGRVDRIGQAYETVRIHNFYYDGTVEAKVYRKLRDRINAFETVVGNLQPILAAVPTFIEQAVMSADPLEEDVLMSEFNNILETPPLRPSLEEMITIDLEADLATIAQPLPQTEVTPELIEELFTNSTILKAAGVVLENLGNQIWEVKRGNKSYKVTFDVNVFNEKPSLRFMSFGEPLFEELLSLVM